MYCIDCGRNVNKNKLSAPIAVKGKGLNSDKQRDVTVKKKQQTSYYIKLVRIQLNYLNIIFGFQVNMENLLIPSEICATRTTIKGKAK